MTAANIDCTIELSLSPQMNKLVSEFAVSVFLEFYLTSFFSSVSSAPQGR